MYVNWIGSQGGRGVGISRLERVHFGLAHKQHECDSLALGADVPLMDGCFDLTISNGTACMEGSASPFDVMSQARFFGSRKTTPQLFTFFRRSCAFNGSLLHSAVIGACDDVFDHFEKGSLKLS